MSSDRAVRMRGKRSLDLTVSIVALTVFSPVLVVIWALIRTTCGAPVIFRQDRPGRHGEVFTMYKFRTMRPAVSGENPWTTDAVRVTKIGALLRRSSLDELPQLLNVVRGEMSLVGPRPLLVEYLDRYSAYHARRHEVRPGVTGLAQVNGRKSVNYSTKLDLDVQYIDEWSFALDLRILAKTLAEPFRRPENREYVEFDDLGLTVGLGSDHATTHGVAG